MEFIRKKVVASDATGILQHGDSIRRYIQNHWDLDAICPVNGQKLGYLEKENICWGQLQTVSIDVKGRSIKSVVN